MIEGIQTDMGRWEAVDFNNLPQPMNRVPLTLEEYDYKTYWVGSLMSSLRRRIPRTQWYIC